MGISKKEQKFQELFTENYSRLFFAALYMINDSETSKDLVNDTFASLWENFDPNSSSYNFTYLYNSVRNRCIDWIRHSEVENRYIELCIQQNSINLLAEDEEKDERLAMIYKIIESMPPKTRFIMDQCYLQKKTYAEVADILSVSKDAIRMHIMKALEMLRNEFSVKYKKGQYSNGKHKR